MLERKKFGGVGNFTYLCSRVNLLKGENDAKSKQIFNKKNKNKNNLKTVIQIFSVLQAAHSSKAVFAVAERLKT